MVRLVLFDVDGTLIFTGGAGAEAFGCTLASVFNCRNGMEGVRFAGRTDLSLVRELFRLNGINPTPNNFRRFFECYPFWLDHLLEGCRGGVYHGVRGLLDGLRALPQPPVTGLLTGNIRLGAELKLRRFGLWDYFDTGAFADEHEDRRAIAALAKRRASQLLNEELRGEQIVVVGDTPHDIECGRAIGARVMAVATGGASLGQLRRYQPDWLLEDLRDVTAGEICGLAARGCGGRGSRVE
jgi:phosphoglycolate phosphatase-like HAD superfamily hydrolase